MQSYAVEIQEQVALGPLTTLRIGGPARFFCRATSEAELLEGVRFARDHHLPLFVLGRGSNVLVADSGFPGLVLQAALGGAIMIDGLRDDLPHQRTVRYDVPAGMDWDEFVLMTCEAKFTGIECLAGIPGMVGGSPVQNIGAYGQEVSQTITAVQVLDLGTLEFRKLGVEECGFGYRRSIFNSSERDRYIVTRVSFEFDLDAEPRLTYADLQRYFAGNAKPPTSLEIYRAVREIRAAKGMLIDPAHPSPDTRSAGSFFKNPVVREEMVARVAAELSLDAASVQRWPAGAGEVKLSAAWLIERAGFAKGFTMGAVGISSRHTLALCNRSGAATCADLLKLRDAIVEEVVRRFGVRLEQEPVLLA